MACLVALGPCRGSIAKVRISAPLRRGAGRVLEQVPLEDLWLILGRAHTLKGAEVQKRGESTLNKHIMMALAAVVLCASIASATPVYGTPVLPGDWTGQRTLTPGGGLNSAGLGNNPFDPGTGISWIITFDGMTNLYTYSYSFFAPNRSGAPQPLEQSHFILELSGGCIVEGQSDCISGFGGKTEFRSNWDSSGPGQSNPGFPTGTSIYGVKFDEELSTYTFLSDRIPVWGNFYAKKANDGLWNFGLESAYSGSDNTLYFIPRPDTDSPAPQIPEPGTFALLGAGIGVFALLRRR